MLQILVGPGGTMLVLGIESSCDETAAAVVRLNDDGTGEILSNVVRSQWQAHQRYGGVVPEIAARAHVEVADSLVELAMGEAGIGFDALDGVAATAGPGLIGGLLVGMMTAKSVALVHDLPFVGVNHLEGHALTIWLTDGLAPPYLLLLVSGGHTQLLIVHGVGRYERLGTTLDDALGEAFDKTAKLLGLGYPGGPQVERLAQHGDGNRFALPRPLKGRSEPHFSFAGLKTAVRQAAQKLAPLSDQDVSDICASFQAAVIDTVCDRVSRAMEIYVQRFPGAAGRHLVIAGGVAANRALSEGLAARISAQGFSRHVAPAALCTDNAAMIAWAGALRLAAGQRDTLDLQVRARWPLDASAPLATGAGIKA